MDLTHVEAVELLESYGVKVSSNSNGLSVIKACAEIIRSQRDAIQGAISLENATKTLKTLRLHAKVMKLEDGDVLWLTTDDADERVYTILRKCIDKVAGSKKVLLLVSSNDDVLLQMSPAQKRDLIKKLQESEGA